MASDLMICDRKVTPRRWTILMADELEGKALADGHIIPWHAWLEHDAAGSLPAGVGAWFAGDDDLTDVQERLNRIPVCALYYPKFTDGRCYSHARRLRALWGFKGDLVAFGDVLRDQLVHMWRCGVNAFYMAEGQDLHKSLRAFNLFSEFYQYNGSYQRGTAETTLSKRA